MESHLSHVMTLSNSIIGVGVLAMPFCFKQCGIILSIVLLIFSSQFSRLACHFLLKSSIMTRRRTFEFLAFHTFGGLGKFVVEIGMIGFLVGTCIAFFVIMGDLGPAIIAKMSGTNPTSVLRISVLIFFAIFCILPLGLLKNVDSLSSVCTATIGFYFCLVLKIVFEAVPHIISGDWIGNVVLWRPDGILQCLPIFSMALFCQTQLFEIYEAIPNASLEKMNELIRKAVNICTCLYIFVGMFGYIAFYNQTLTGNILMRFLPSITADIMKLGFVLSVAFSFPLVIFPCRASLYSLLYKPSNSPYDIVNQTRFIPQTKFVSITIAIIIVSLIIAILIPNIELVLGLVGSTIGVMICILFPATTFVCISTKNTNERILAQIMLCIGIVVMVLGTYANLYAIEKIEMNPVTEKAVLAALNNDRFPPKMNSLNSIPVPNEKINNPVKLELPPILTENKIVDKIVKEEIALKETRREPPQPVEPAEVSKEVVKQESKKPLPEVETNLKDNKLLLTTPKAEVEPVVTAIIARKANQDEKLAENSKKKEEVNIDAIKKEDKELQESEKQLNNFEQQIKEREQQEKKEHLIKTLEKNLVVQQELLDEQKQMLQEKKLRQDAIEKEQQEKMKEEKLKAVNLIKDIAEKAIQNIGKLENAEAPELKPEKLEEKPVQPPNKNEVLLNADNKIGSPPSNDAPIMSAPLSYQLGLEKSRKQPTLQDIVGVPPGQRPQNGSNAANGTTVLQQLQQLPPKVVPPQIEPQVLNNLLQPDDSQQSKQNKPLLNENHPEDNKENNEILKEVAPVPQDTKIQPIQQDTKEKKPPAGRDLERDNLRRKRNADEQLCDKKKVENDLNNVVFNENIAVEALAQASMSFKSRRK